MAPRYTLDHLMNLRAKVELKDSLSAEAMNGGGLLLQKFHRRAHQIVALVGNQYNLDGLGQLEELATYHWGHIVLSGPALTMFERLKQDFTKDPRTLRHRQATYIDSPRSRKKMIRRR